MSAFSKGRRTLTVSVPDAIFDACHQAAVADNRNLSNCVAVLLEGALAERNITVASSPSPTPKRRTAAKRMEAA